MPTTKAAGILFVTPDRQALFLKRGPGGDHPGEWCFPGGEAEPDETVEDTATRETREELGFCPRGERIALTRRIYPNENLSGAPADTVPIEGEPVDFTTFIQEVKATFAPRLNGEHTGWSWADVDEPPEPLHPGARVALRRLSMDELGIAEAIRDGDLVSPQRYENITLVALRITGTGVAYRTAHEEYAFRDPSIYLTQEFLTRCQGLPVVMEHPAGTKLDSEGFHDRIVGTIMLPYIRNDEVWGIAKIFDDFTRELIETDRLSTSPGVVFRDPSVNEKTSLDDGSALLLEGKPSLLDHLALCEQGVWDKGGIARGVESITNGDQAMADEKENMKKEEARGDADAGQKIDKFLTRMDAAFEKMDSLAARMDAWEEKSRKDAEMMADKAKKDAADCKMDAGKDPIAGDKESGEPKMDKSKKDAAAPEEPDDEDEAKKDKAKKDAAAMMDKSKKDDDMMMDKSKKDAEDEARKDSDLRKIKAQLARMPKSHEDSDYEEMAEQQARWDSVYAAFSSRARAPLQGESPLEYRRALARQMQRHSPTWKDVDLRTLTGDAMAIVEGQIRNDAALAARQPVDLPDGGLREVVTSDPVTGRRTVNFYGKGTIFGAMNRKGRNVVGMNFKQGAA